MAQVFTLTVFYELQVEIEAACFYCSVVGIHAYAGKLFERLGFVCRHMFLVFKDAEMVSLPSRYIAARWCKQEGLASWCARCSDCPPLETVPSQLWTEIHNCAVIVGSNKVRQTRMLQVIKELRDEFLGDGMDVDPPKGNGVAIAALCGVEPPTSIIIKPPAQAKNKGPASELKANAS
ncbi:PREDICTED: uncharacterized protein LOC109174166 [Ipomoea nil]|uniref:uncharacterized protein LOC109174166 n=1 Tax=Ipomoea nil TaxID=35883 RepID=UPI000901F061|nr:PREDICTED: uncharacterized protein LOC109174166 [Ipomoea nil]